MFEQNTKVNESYNPDTDEFNWKLFHYTLYHAIPFLAVCLFALVFMDKFFIKELDDDTIYQGKQSTQVTRPIKPVVPVTVPQINNKVNLKEMKMKTLVDTIWCENRKSKKSMELVMSVIYTRAKTKDLDGYYEKAVKPYQFSCLNDKETILAQVRSAQDDLRYTEAKEIVNRYVHQNAKPIIEAEFYYAPKKVKKPSYLKDKALVLRYEGHDFYSSSSNVKDKLAKL